MKKHLLLFVMLTTISLYSQQKSSFISLKHKTSSGVTDTIQNAPILVDVNHNVVVGGNQKVSATQYDATVSQQVANGYTTWINSFNTTNNKAWITASITDGSGNVYVCGAIRTNSTNGLDYLTIKYNSSGVQQWVSYYNGTASSSDIASALCFDNNGDIMVTGASTGTSTALIDIVTVKYLKTTGVQQWTNRYDYANSYDVPVSIVNASGKITVSGQSGSTFTTFDYVTIRYTTAGAVSSTTRTTNSSAQDKVFGMITDSLGNVYVTGSAWNGAHYDIVTQKLDTNLAIVWSKSFDGYGFEDAGLSASLDANLNVYVTGYTYRSSTEREMVVLKYDNSGNLNWSVKKRPAESGSTAEGIKVVVKNTNEIFVGGHFTTNSNQDIALLRFNQNGRQTLETKYDGPLNSTDKFLDMAVDPDTNLVFISGRTYAGTTVDSNIVLTYQYNDIPIAVTYSASTPKRLTGQLFVSFQPTALDTAAINNKDLVHGYLLEFLSGSALSSLNSSCSTSVARFLCSKVVPDLTINDSISVTRSGRTIKMPPHWTTFVVYHDLSDTLLASQFRAAGNVVRWVQFNELGPEIAGANDTHYNNGNSSNLKGMGGINNANINIEPAWDMAEGLPAVKVGVFDSGINFTHQDFGNGTFAGSKIAGGKDFANGGASLNTNNSDDPTGHGTAVAAIIGAIRNNNFGTTGVAGGNSDSSNTGCALYNMRTHDTIGVACGAYSSSGARYQAIIKGAQSTNIGGFGLHINNHSWTTSYYADMAMYEAMSTAFANEVFLAVGSGNDDAQGGAPCNFHTYPACFPDRMVTEVGANDSSGTRVGFSECGLNLDVIAPGTQDLYASPTRTGSAFSDSLIYNISSGQCINGITGTSFAAPHVAGVAALLKSYDKKTFGTIGILYPDICNWYPEDMEEIIQLSATDLTVSPNSVGPDPETGYGRLNAGKALSMVKYPDYVIWHQKAVVNASTAVLVGSNEVTCNWANIFGISSPTTHVNRYRVTATVSHTIPTGYNFIKGWDLDAGSNVVGINSGAAGTENCGQYFNFPNYRIPSHYDVTTTITATGATLQGYIYEVLTPTIPTTSLGWYPPQFAGLTGTVNLAYSLYLTTNAVGLPEHNNSDWNGLSLYPNPANDKVIITINTPGAKSIDVTVYNVIGQKIIEEKNVYLTDTKSIDVSGFKNGLYLFELSEENNKRTVKKVVISH